MAGMTQTKLRIMEITQFDPHFGIFKYWDLKFKLGFKNTLYKGVKTNFSWQQSSLICPKCSMRTYDLWAIIL